MSSFHHGISKKEPSSGIIPMKDADTSTIALIAFANDADESVFPLNTPALVTSLNRALAASGTEGNLRSSLEAIAAITSPTLIVVRIEDPFAGNSFDQSKVIGTTLESGERTGLQALRIAKSLLGLIPKIIIAPDVESESVIQAIGSLCQRFRAYSYVTPRDDFGVMLETKEQVVQLRDRLGFREVELIWPEWSSGNVFLGPETDDLDLTTITRTGVRILNEPINRSGTFSMTFDYYRNNKLITQNQTVEYTSSTQYIGCEDVFFGCLRLIFSQFENIIMVYSGGGIGHFYQASGCVFGGFGTISQDYIKIVIKRNALLQNDVFPLLKDQFTALPFEDQIELITLGQDFYEAN